MENKEYRAWFENTRKSNQETIDQTEAIFEGLILKIASGAMAISFSFITALSTKIEYYHTGRQKEIAKQIYLILTTIYGQMETPIVKKTYIRR